MISYCLTDDKQQVIIRDVGLGGESLMMPINAWRAWIDLPLELDDRIYFTKELCFLHIRNEFPHKCFRTILGARQSIKDTPGYTFSIQVLRLY